jgi:hypothetical protein
VNGNEESKAFLPIKEMTSWSPIKDWRTEGANQVDANTDNQWHALAIHFSIQLLAALLLLLHLTMMLLPSN